jgi:hypothetical protein
MRLDRAANPMINAAPMCFRVVRFVPGDDPARDHGRDPARPRRAMIEEDRARRARAYGAVPPREICSPTSRDLVPQTNAPRI